MLLRNTETAAGSTVTHARAKLIEHVISLYGTSQPPCLKHIRPAFQYYHLGATLSSKITNEKHKNAKKNKQTKTHQKTEINHLNAKRTVTRTLFTERGLTDEAEGDLSGQCAHPVPSTNSPPICPRPLMALKAPQTLTLGLSTNFSE